MTYMNSIGPEEISRRKSVSDAKNETEELTFSQSKVLVKSRACIAYGDYVERKRLDDELKEVWEH